MRIGGAGAVLLALLVSSVGTAAGGVNLGLEFNPQKMLGYTKYHINFTEFYPEIGTDVKGDSELEFPLDVFLVGGTLRLEGQLESGEPWGVELGASKNLNHPRGQMKDSDWIAVPQYHVNSKFSYTESDAQLDALLVHVEAHLGIVRRTDLGVDLVGGYEYQDFSFEILGIQGWQGFDISNRILIDTLQGVNVLDYDVKYHIPYGGLHARFQFSPRVGLGTKAVISPRAGASDHDDHLLRFFTADGDCSGWAWKTAADLRWILSGDSGRSGWALGLGFGYTGISIKGTQDQVYYGDEPSTPEEDETGMEFNGIKQKITSSQVTIQATLGYQF
jgi:hypothetical protein